MINILYAFGAWILTTALARILVGAGVAVVYYVVLATVANELVDILIDQIQNLPTAPYNLIGLAGLWQGMGYILSAILARVTLQATSPRLIRATE